MVWLGIIMQNSWVVFSEFYDTAYHIGAILLKVGFLLAYKISTRGAIYISGFGTKIVLVIRGKNCLGKLLSLPYDL